MEKKLILVCACLFKMKEDIWTQWSSQRTISLDNANFVTTNIYSVSLSRMSTEQIIKHRFRIGLSALWKAISNQTISNYPIHVVHGNLEFK